MSSQSSTLIIVVVCVVVGGLVSVFQFKDKNDPAPLDDGLKAEIGQLKDSLARNNEDIQALRQALADFKNSSIPQSTGLTAAEVKRLIGEAKLANSSESVASETSVEETSRGTEFNLKRELAKFSSNPDDWESRESFWAEVAKNGLFKEALAWFEARARSAANDPDAAADLGEAYIAALRRGGVNQMEMGTYGKKADEAFDKALDLDNTHWRSRFQKAVSLSFWPDAMGRKPEAIKNFEILVEQQKNKPAEPRFAATHLFLGNIQAQNGQMDKARESWKAGLAFDPENKDLKQKLAMFGAE